MNLRGYYSIFIPTFLPLCRNSRFFIKVTLGILEFPKLEFFLELDIKTTFECDFKDFVDKRIKI